ncbi:MAG: type II toxin-antitoxin system VapC family toxin [Planctomyces sp.]|nr:type II toxin-antitoxin system VapC family toxin [Planctomyces sp.]
MASIYIETSIVSYLRERQASHVVAAARQILTKRWWSDERKKYTLVTSQYVIDEASLGDSVLAQERLLYLDDLPLLAVDPEIVVLADALMSSAALPRKAESDALHIAVAAWHGVEYLLTWNCTHLANARTLPVIQKVLRDRDVFAPIICTPENLMSDDTQLDD